MAEPIGSYESNKKVPPQEYTDWKSAPSDENYKNLMSYLKPTIDSGITSFAANKQSLRTRANILASQALESYEPEKAALKTHVFNHLKRLQRYQQERGHVVHVPENRRADAGRVHKYVLEFQDKQGIEPSDSQLSDHFGMSLKRVRRARYGGEIAESQVIRDKGDLPGTIHRDPEKIWADYVYHDLDSINQKIFEWTIGYGGADKLSKKEIARRLKMTPSAVSQRSASIRQQLQLGVQS